MQSKKLEFTVGLFLLAGLLALAVMAIKVSGINQGYSGKTYSVTALFTNVGGLQAGARVTASGVTIGKVTDIHLDAASYKAMVTMDIDANVNYLSTDSIAAIQTSGVLGEQYVAISVGADDTMLAEGSTIEDTSSAMVLEELIGKLLSSLTKS
jgi:phospholipid/cholesterol/gamma-HCH transport system substrate-binding protein